MDTQELGVPARVMETRDILSFVMRFAAPSKPATPPTRPATPTRPTTPTILANQFTFVGQGICLDSQSDYYDFVEYYSVPTVDGCAVKCGDLIKSYPSVSFVGMEYSMNIQSCLCNFVNEMITAKPTNSSDWYSGNSGTGLPSIAAYSANNSNPAQAYNTYGKWVHICWARQLPRWQQ